MGRPTRNEGSTAYKEIGINGFPGSILNTRREGSKNSSVVHWEKEKKRQKRSKHFKKHPGHGMVNKRDKAEVEKEARKKEGSDGNVP